MQDRLNGNTNNSQIKRNEFTWFGDVALRPRTARIEICIAVLFRSRSCSPKHWCWHYPPALVVLHAVYIVLTHQRNAQSHWYGSWPKIRFSKSRNWNIVLKEVSVSVLFAACFCKMCCLELEWIICEQPQTVGEYLWVVVFLVPQCTKQTMRS